MKSLSTKTPLRPLIIPIAFITLIGQTYEMNLRDLDYICAVAEHRHFGRASEACYVSQPTLSGQIKKLEEELGVTLFERGHRGIHVTDIGEDIIAIAREARDAARRIRSVATAAQDPLAGTLSVGLIPTIAPYLIPRFVSQLQRDLNKLSVHYQEDITERLVEALLSGDLDVAILATPPEDDSLRTIELYQEPFWMVFPNEHPLAKDGALSMAEADHYDILLLTEGHCFRDQALSICQPSQKPQQKSLRATSLETLINLVASGQGVTLVPALAMREGWSTEINLGARKIKDKGASRRIYLTYRKQFTRIEAVQALAEIIRNGLPDSVEKL